MTGQMALAFPYIRVKKRKDWPAFKKKSRDKTPDPGMDLAVKKQLYKLLKDN